MIILVKATPSEHTDLCPYYICHGFENGQVID